MKSTKLLIAIFIISTFLAKSQEKTFKFGVSAGVYLSKFSQGTKTDETYPIGNPRGIEVTYEDKFYPNPCLGIIFLMNKSHKVSFQTELNYTFSRHKIEYVRWNILGPDSRYEYADFSINYSIFQLSFFPQFSMGKENIIKLLCGPYYNLNVIANYSGQIEVKTYNIVTQVGATTLIEDQDINNALKSGFGALVGLGVCFPSERRNISLDFKIGRNFSDIIESPNIKETFASLSIVYFLGNNLRN